MVAKKLLDRFENSPKVWTIKQERDEKGNLNWVTKIYNSIADAHRDNPKFSCSHIEDYCNATFFTKNNHWFAYVGYKMAPSLQEIMANCSYEPIKENRTKNDDGILYYGYLREDLISSLSRHMWDDIRTIFLGETYKYTHLYTSNAAFYADSCLAPQLISADSTIMYGLYYNGWHSGDLKQKAIDWCKKNITRNDLLERGSKPVVVATKPEIKYWKTQSYKQENYL